MNLNILGMLPTCICAYVYIWSNEAINTFGDIRTKYKWLIENIILTIYWIFYGLVVNTEIWNNHNYSFFNKNSFSLESAGFCHNNTTTPFRIWISYYRVHPRRKYILVVGTISRACSKLLVKFQTPVRIRGDVRRYICK